ncbi:Penicillin-binding protein 1A [compost metagenome]
MLRPRLKTILFRFTILLTLVIIAGLGFATYSFFTLEKEMSKKLESKKFLTPTEYFAAPPTFAAKTLVSLEATEQQLLRQNYRRRDYDQRLLPGDYFVAPAAECSSRLQVGFDQNQNGCIGWVSSDTPASEVDQEIQVLVFQNDGQISQTLKGSPFVNVPEVTLEAPLLAQYVGTEPLMQTTVSLGQVPPTCLNAIMAIEDAQFLEHGGVSLKSIGRAFIKNLTSGRAAQGGSTITQQLVKNYFLTAEKSLSRKYNEFIISILLESRFSKDEILELYLNVIYMGQNGAFQVRGYGSAAKFYFNKEVSDLNLSECALTAAIVNSPGAFNPFRRPEAAMKRRNLVIEKMKDLSYITPEQAQEAIQSPLPTRVPTLASETAPYYLDAVRKQLNKVGVAYEGTRIYTGLDLEAQQVAQESLRNHLDKLEGSFKNLIKLKSEGNTLEGIVLSANNTTGLVNVVVGGRNYRMTQFNRAIDGHRQIGSVMKPFVYLTALLNNTPEGTPYTPITILSDEKFTTKYEGQSWSPDNYGKKYFGMVPMFFALKNSLNAATASLGLAVGLGNIIDVTHSMGVESELKPLPSMTLGSFEMYPKEVLQAYLSMAAMGQKRELSFVRKIEDNEGREIFRHNSEPTKTVDPTAVASLVSMMKQTVLSGTARSITLNGFFNPAAGKTGTTSDNKDAWFAGFTPYLTTVVWVGYDNNKPHKLTGSNGAVPVWTQFMKKIGVRYPADDFPWPEGTVKITLDDATLSALGAKKENEDPTSVDLIFKEGTQP